MPSDPGFLCGMTFQAWVSARKQLACAVQDYVDATIALGAVFLDRPSKQPFVSYYELALAKIDQELPSILSEEQKLQGVRPKLKALRNTSRQLVPISRLPQEILTIVFTLAGVKYLITGTNDAKSSPAMPTVISSVCSSWRRISLSAHWLWSHIDISLGGLGACISYPHARLWETRSWPSPLTIRILGDPALDLLPTEALASTLFPYPLMARVSGVEAVCGGHMSSSCILDIIAHWMRNGSTAQSAQVLKIGNSDVYSGLWGQDIQRLLISRQNEPLTIDEYEVFLRPIHTLHLHWSFIPWGSAAFQGLVDLYISAHGDSSPLGQIPTQSQLAKVLAACPKLHSLRLVGLTVLPDHHFDPSPIALNCLNTLSVLSGTVGNAAIKWILPLIGNTSPSLDLGLTLDMRSDCVAATRSFFARCNVTRLFVCMKSMSPHCFVPLLARRFPHLQLLALRYCDFSPNAAWMVSDMEPDPTSEPWPQLRRLLLINCRLDVNRMEQVLAYHPVQGLGLLGCTLNGTLVKDTELEELRDVRQTVPKIVFGEAGNLTSDYLGWDLA